jgi:hypothetical protein
VTRFVGEHRQKTFGTLVGTLSLGMLHWFVLFIGTAVAVGSVQPALVNTLYQQDFSSIPGVNGTYSFTSNKLPELFSNQATYSVTYESDARGGLYVLGQPSSQVLVARATSDIPKVIFGIAVQSSVSGIKNVNISFFGAQVRFGGHNNSDSSLDAFFCLCSRCDIACSYENENEWVHLPGISIGTYVTERPGPEALSLSLGRTFSTSLTWKNFTTLNFMWKTTKTSGSTNSFGLTDIVVTFSPKKNPTPPKSPKLPRFVYFLTCAGILFLLVLIVGFSLRMKTSGKCNKTCFEKNGNSQVSEKMIEFQGAEEEGMGFLENEEKRENQSSEKLEGEEQIV